MANGSNEIEKWSVVQLLETKFGNYDENVQRFEGTFVYRKTKLRTSKEPVESRIKLGELRYKEKL